MRVLGSWMVIVGVFVTCALVTQRCAANAQVRAPVDGLIVRYRRPADAGDILALRRGIRA